MIDYDRFSALSSPAWLAGLGLGAAFLFGIVAGFDGFALALGVSLMTKASVDWQRVSAVGLFAAAFGMIFGGGGWALLAWRMLKEITGIGRETTRRYGKSKLTKRVDHPGGYHIDFQYFDVHPGNWEIMAERVVRGGRMTSAWVHYFQNRSDYEKFRDDCVAEGICAWRNPDERRQGVDWTEKGVQFWKDMHAGKIDVESPTPRRGGR